MANPVYQFDPEAIANAVLSVLQGITAFTFNTISRRGDIYTNVPITAQPYLALIERGITGVQDTAIGLEKWTVHFLILIYIRADATPQGVPGTTLNAAFKAVEEALQGMSPGQKNTLGGLANRVWINGQTLIDTGILDQQCAMLIPVDVETGI